MIRILDITFKDLLQLVRDFKTFMFLLLMPIIFTLLFGYAFGGFSGGSSDSRIPVGYLNQDDNWLTDALHDQLAGSAVLRLEEAGSPSALEKMVADQDVPAAILIPDGYGRMVLKDRSVRLTVIADTESGAWSTIEAEVLAATSRVEDA